MIRELSTRLRFLILRKRRGELEEELKFHLDQAIASNMDSGLIAAEARRQALIAFGGVELTREQCERQRPGWWVGTVFQDVRYAFRGFRRNPLFTLSVLITLALGIGATTAVFSVVDRILFRPLPYADPGRIVSLGFVHSLERQEFLMGRFYLDWQKDQKPFFAIASQGTGVHNCDLVENNPAQLNCISFQSGFLPLLGISPILGRNFLPEEDRPNGPHVVMISYGLWKGHYNEDPHILGSTINLDGNPVRVVGVLPKEFQFPTLEAADIVVPMALNPALQQKINGGFGNPMRVFARLKPGVSVAQAYAQMQPLVDSERNQFPASVFNEVRLSIRPLRDRETQDVRSVAWILFGFVLAVLFIACANVASLIMARGAGRHQELAVRSAIGASRSRLIRQSLTEALLLSFAGGIAGLATARVMLLVFIALAPTGIPFISTARLDLRIAAFAALVSCICGVVFGLAPALQKSYLATLNAKTRMSRSHALLRRCLVTAQIAISIVLLSGAAMLLHSYEKIETQKLGIQAGGVLSVKVALPWAHCNTNQKAMDFYLRLESVLRALPGTRALGMADSIPPGGWQGDFRYADLIVKGRPKTPPGIGGSVVHREVTPDYFRALDIPIIRGRNFADQDRTSEQREVLLSRLMAARMFPNQDSIGEQIQVADPVYGEAWFTVVGVVDNVKNSGLMEQSEPEIYFLRRNVSDDWNGNRNIILIDSVLPPETIEPGIRSAVASIDRTVPVNMEPLDQTIGQLADRQRFETALLVFFAFTGLVLAVVGLYGLVAFMTTQRTHEIGLRMALGATRGNILRLIAGDGLLMVVVGLVVGLGISLAVSRMLKALLFQVSVYDPLTYIVVPLLLSLVALIAILIPARAGMRVEPAVTLRAE
jgi:predicted permease